MALVFCSATRMWNCSNKCSENVSPDNSWPEPLAIVNDGLLYFAFCSLSCAKRPSSPSSGSGVCGSWMSDGRRTKSLFHLMRLSTTKKFSSASSSRKPRLHWTLSWSSSLGGEDGLRSISRPGSLGCMELSPPICLKNSAGEFNSNCPGFSPPLNDRLFGSTKKLF